MTPSRRQILRGAATTTAAAAFTIVPRHVLGGPRFVPPSEKINIAIVGVGGQGRTNLRELMKFDDAQVIAIADPADYWDLSPYYFRGAAGRTPVRAEIEKHYSVKTPNFRCNAYEDYRQMFEKEKGIDAVLATTDHHHAGVTLRAMREGKHVYCEKPLTHNVAEARLVAKVAKETGVATQMGNQGHSNNGMRDVVEVIQAGAIGPVREVHAWVGSRRWNPTIAGKLDTNTHPVPAGLNWDLWIGPREPRPYHPAYAPVIWRDWWAFGSGIMGDFACHDLDAPMWALDLHDPETVEFRPIGYSDAEIQGHGELGYYTFAARGNRPAVKVFWYSGGARPATPEEMGPNQRMPNQAVLFVGDKGKLITEGEGSGGPWRLLPVEKFADYQRPAQTIPRVANHHRNWLDAIKGGPAACSNFEYATRLAELSALGVAALRAGTKLYWDPVNLTAPGVKNADELFKGTYRKGWELS